jgi:hypothetical protein
MIPPVDTNEAQDVAGSIRHALRCWEFVAEDAQAWKWIILALHSALQGACVCHLVTTEAPISAVTKKNACEWKNYFEESRTNSPAKPPTTQLMALPELLKAVRKPNSAGDTSSDNQVSIDDTELCWLIGIHKEFRNQFVHFRPMGWHFDVSGIPKLAHLVARIIHDILDCLWAFRHLGEELRDLLIEDLEQLSAVTLPNS